MNKNTKVTPFAVVIQLIILTVVSASLSAQTAPHTVKAAFGVPVSGPETSFTINLSVEPADIDISGFSFIVAYDNHEAILESVSDNTGQPSSGVEYTIGSEQPFGSEVNVNVSVPVIMDTAFSLTTPSNIAQLNFSSTAAYDSDNPTIWIYLYDHLGEGLIDANFQPIPTEYDTQQPSSSVNDWMNY